MEVTQHESLQTLPGSEEEEEEDAQEHEWWTRAVVVTGLQRVRVAPDPLLHDAFSAFGEITFLSFDQHQGAGLVCFRTRRAAERALALDHEAVASHAIRVMPLDPHRDPHHLARLFPPSPGLGASPTGPTPQGVAAAAAPPPPPGDDNGGGRHEESDHSAASALSSSSSSSSSSTREALPFCRPLAASAGLHHQQQPHHSKEGTWESSCPGDGGGGGGGHDYGQGDAGDDGGDDGDYDYDGEGERTQDGDGLLLLGEEEEEEEEDDDEGIGAGARGERKGEDELAASLASMVLGSPTTTTRNGEDDELEEEETEEEEEEEEPEKDENELPEEQQHDSKGKEGHAKAGRASTRAAAASSYAEGPEMGLEFENARLVRRGKPVLFNFRDISFATLHDPSGVRLRPGVMYRSACWSRASISHHDVIAILQFWQEACDIRTLLDLRSKAEKLEDQFDAVAEKYYRTVTELDLYHYLPNETSGGPGKTCAFKGPRYRRFPVDLVTRRLTYRGLMMGAPKRVYLKMMACSFRGSGAKGRDPIASSSSSLLSPTRGSSDLASGGRASQQQQHQQGGDHERKDSFRRRAHAALSASAPDLRHHYRRASSPVPLTARGPRPSQQQQSQQQADTNLYDVDLREEEEEEENITGRSARAVTASQVFVSEVFNPLGLLGFTRLILEYSARELGQALRLLIDKRNHPILIHCSSGKDRTGLLVALVLSVCGVARETIIENYAESEKHLRSVMGDIIRENRSKGLGEHFDGTPREVMRDTLALIDQRWGSVAAFLNSACSFSFVEQAYLRKLLVAAPTHSS